MYFLKSLCLGFGLKDARFPGGYICLVGFHQTECISTIECICVYKLSIFLTTFILWEFKEKSVGIVGIPFGNPIERIVLEWV